MNIQMQEMMANMEFLLKELHKEWDRSGEAKVLVKIPIDDLDEVNRKMVGRIAIQGKKAEIAGDGFKKCVRLSHEGYVLLRMMRKFKKAEDKAYRDGCDGELEIPLDKEEHGLFQEIFRDNTD